MDDIVKAALKKWPNVPHCYGWLALDARGQWRMRDERCQHLNLPGDIIRHTALIEFIHRNYQVDASGCWYFQNGPQRVYVDLHRTPYIIRTSTNTHRSDTGLQFHTGETVHHVEQFYLDQAGNLLLSADHRLAQIDDRDLAQCLRQIHLNGVPANVDTLFDALHDSLAAADASNAACIGQLTLMISNADTASPVSAPLLRKELSTLMQEYGYQATPRAA